MHLTVTQMHAAALLRLASRPGDLDSNVFQVSRVNSSSGMQDLEVSECKTERSVRASFKSLSIMMIMIMILVTILVYRRCSSTVTLGSLNY
jgi:hypothetical protein